jgi:phosphoglycolate phosphatase
MFVAFDLDGTLIDSVGDLAASANELALSLGGRPLALDEVADMVGEGAALLVQRALTAAGVDPATPGALARFFEIYDRRLLDQTAPYPGVREMLPIIGRRARMGVLTNKPLGFSQRILRELNLTAFFEDVLGGDGPHPRKPAAAGLLALTAGATDTVLLVGDSPIDWQTSQNAGCLFAWARYGFGAQRFDGGPPDTPYVLDRPSDLVAVVDRLAAISSGR